MCIVCLNLAVTAIVPDRDGPSSTMCAAVSENRRTVTCFVCIGYKWAERRAGCPGVTEPTASNGPLLGCSLALLCFKAVVNQVHSAIAAAAAAAACSARAASSAASRAGSSTGATRGCCAPGVVSDGAGGIRGAGGRRHSGHDRDSFVSSRCRDRATTPSYVAAAAGGNAVGARPSRSAAQDRESCRHPTAATARQARCRATRRAIKLVARIPARGSRGGR